MHELNRRAAQGCLVRDEQDPPLLRRSVVLDRHRYTAAAIAPRISSENSAPKRSIVKFCS